MQTSITNNLLTPTQHSDFPEDLKRKKASTRQAPRHGEIPQGNNLEQSPSTRETDSAYTY